MRRVSKELEELRNRELHRLMALLEKDPERGLRYALPMRCLNEWTHRGLSSPGARLDPRPVDFNLSHLTGGNPADPWKVSWDYHQKFTAKYRELALREKKLGRYRRAAYIFAELLGDLSAAANALREGKHFTEAAVLYRDHLRQWQAAAECFAECGLYREAIELYEKEERFVAAAGLYEKLGLKDAAVAALRAAVQKCCADHDFLAASKILEELLGSPEEAQSILEAAWPDSLQAGACLQALLKMWGRLGWHERTIQRLATLRSEATAPRQIALVTRILSGLATHYPDRDVRRAAADLARVKAAKRLAQAGETEARDLIQSLQHLVPQDRLFPRDAARFLALQRQKATAKSSGRLAERILGPLQIRSFELRYPVRWLDVRSCGGHFCAVGSGFGDLQDQLVAARGVWEGMTQMLTWEIAPPHQPLVMDVELNFAYLLCPERPLVREQVFPASDWMFNHVMRAGAPAWLPADTMALACRRESLWLLRRQPDRLLLECHLADGRLLSSLPSAELSAAFDRPTPRISMVAQRDFVAVGVGNKLVLYSRLGRVQTFEFDSDIVRLAGAPAHLRAALAVCLEDGVALHWIGASGFDRLDADFAAAHLAFTKMGTLVALSRRSGRLYSVYARAGAHQSVRFECPGESPLAVVCAGGADQFAVFTSEGSARLFEVRKDFRF
jgi:tetratricopeptide (TPR) repeat protein